MISVCEVCGKTDEEAVEAETEAEAASGFPETLHICRSCRDDRQSSDGLMAHDFLK